MKRVAAILGLACSLSLAAGTQAGAAPILVGQGAFISPTLINFNGVGNEVAITNQYVGSGVTFSGALLGMTNPGDTNMFPANGGGTIASNWNYSISSHVGLSFTATFASLQQRVGFWLENHNNQIATIELFNGATSLGSVNYQTSGGLQAEFVGIQDLLGFDRAVFTNTAQTNGFYAIDDFRFEGQEVVPEPATLMLLGAGLLAAGRRVRRSRR